MAAPRNERMQWNEQANRDLLSCIYAEIPLGSALLRKVAHRMQETGYSCSPKSITQHLQKLRRKENSGTASPKTPGRKSGDAVGKKTGNKRINPEDDEDSEDDVKPTPPKKVKNERGFTAVKKEPSIKKEANIKKERTIKKEVKSEYDSDDDDKNAT